MLNRIWKPHGITIDTADITGGTIGGIESYSVSDSLQIDRQAVDGSPYPIITTLQSRQETIKATTFNPDDVIDILGVSGQCIKGNNTNDGIQFWIGQWDQCSNAPVAGSVHRNFGMAFSGAPVTTRGIISLESISCDHQGDARASIAVDLTAPDGSTTYAITEGSALALPAIGDNRRRYTLAKMTVGGVLVEHKTSFQLTSGINIQRVATDSNIAAEFVFVSEEKPVIAIRGIDPTWSIPRSGLACTHANTVLYFRRRGETSGVDFEADAATKHIKFTVKGIAFKDQLAGGNAMSPSETALVIYPEYDSGSSMVPIVATTGVAIV